MRWGGERAMQIESAVKMWPLNLPETAHTTHKTITIHTYLFGETLDGDHVMLRPPSSSGYAALALQVEFWWRVMSGVGVRLLSDTMSNETTQTFTITAINSHLAHISENVKQNSQTTTHNHHNHNITHLSVGKFVPLFSPSSTWRWTNNRISSDDQFTRVNDYNARGAGNMTALIHSIYMNY